MRHLRLRFGAAFVAVALSPFTTVQAQSPQSPPAPQILGPGPKACPPDVPVPPRASSDRPLSEQLSESKGIICPPAGVDPQIVERPAPTRDNPVIPAPGSPGGDQTVKPR
jgi:hypothetical protein